MGYVLHGVCMYCIYNIQYALEAVKHFIRLGPNWNVNVCKLEISHYRFADKQNGWITDVISDGKIRNMAGFRLYIRPRERRNPPKSPSKRENQFIRKFNNQGSMTWLAPNSFFFHNLIPYREGLINAKYYAFYFLLSLIICLLGGKSAGQTSNT